nr:MAG TPA: hypothetical protein [Crassvirales sp.]
MNNKNSTSVLNSKNKSNGIKQQQYHYIILYNINNIDYIIYYIKRKNITI